MDGDWEGTTAEERAEEPAREENAVEMSSESSVRVQIFGKVYQLRGDGDPDRTRRVAELVDRKMGVLADSRVASDSYRIAVLAALELADELLELRDAEERRQGRAAGESDRLAALLARVDQVSHEDEPPADDRSFYAAAD